MHFLLVDIPGRSIKMTKDKLVKTTFLVGHAEGISYILLLFVAMPLKYLFDTPQAVSMVGMAHGLLFIAYLYMIVASKSAANWKWLTAGGLFVMSLVPFGTFFQKKVVSKLEA